MWVLAAQVAAGLAHIHAYGILHLDIKPDNIFLDRHGRAAVQSHSFISSLSLVPITLCAFFLESRLASARPHVSSLSPSTR